MNSPRYFSFVESLQDDKEKKNQKQPKTFQSGSTWCIGCIGIGPAHCEISLGGPMRYYLLHAAVISEDSRAVRKLLASGADPNQPDCNYTRPVHLAALLKDTAILSDLIQHWAQNPAMPQMVWIAELKHETRDKLCCQSRRCFRVRDWLRLLTVQTSNDDGLFRVI